MAEKTEISETLDTIESILNYLNGNPELLNSLNHWFLIAVIALVCYFAS